LRVRLCFNTKDAPHHIPDKKAPEVVGAMDKWAQDITRLAPDWQAKPFEYAPYRQALKTMNLDKTDRVKCSKKSRIDTNKRS